MRLQPESSSHAGQAYAPLMPPGSAPVQPVAPGRSAGSTCLCVVEAILAAIVFLYTAPYLTPAARTAYSHDNDGNSVQRAFLFVALTAFSLVNSASGIVLFVTGGAAMTGVAHSLGRSTPQGATSPGDIDHVERDRLADSLERDGVNLFDFHEIVTTSVSILSGVSAWLLLQLVSVIIFAPYVFYAVMSSFGNSKAGPNAASLLAVIALALIVWRRLFYWFRFDEKFRNLEQACRTQPSCKRVRAVLVLSSITYAIGLYLSPAPSVWQWSLIVTHTARALKLLASLRDQSEGMRAAGDNHRDVP